MDRGQRTKDRGRSTEHGALRKEDMERSPGSPSSRGNGSSPMIVVLVMVVAVVAVVVVVVAVLVVFSRRLDHLKEEHPLWRTPKTL